MIEPVYSVCREYLCPICKKRIVRTFMSNATPEDPAHIHDGVPTVLIMINCRNTSRGNAEKFYEHISAYYSNACDIGASCHTNLPSASQKLKLRFDSPYADLVFRLIEG